MQSTVFSNSRRTKLRHDAYAVSTQESLIIFMFPSQMVDYRVDPLSD